MNKVYFQKTRLLYHAAKYAFLTGWFRSYDSDGDPDAAHSARSLAYFKLQVMYRDVLYDLISNGK